VVQLIPSENHKVWFLDIQDPSNEVNREWVSLTLWRMFPMGIKASLHTPTPVTMCVSEIWTILNLPSSRTLNAGRASGPVWPYHGARSALQPVPLAER
jgi:hypothetical protein